MSTLHFERCEPHRAPDALSPFEYTVHGHIWADGETSKTIIQSAPLADAIDTALAAAEARGRQWAIDALRDRAAGTVVGRLLARTNGNVNGIEIAAELADYLDSLTKEGRQDGE